MYSIGIYGTLRLSIPINDTPSVQTRKAPSSIAHWYLGRYLLPTPSTPSLPPSSILTSRYRHCNSTHSLESPCSATPSASDYGWLPFFLPSLWALA